MGLGAAGQRGPSEPRDRGRAPRLRRRLSINNAKHEGATLAIGGNAATGAHLDKGFLHLSRRVGDALFGGFKDSGLGCERRLVAMEEFLQAQHPMIDFSNEQRDPFAAKP